MASQTDWESSSFFSLIERVLSDNNVEQEMRDEIESQGEYAGLDIENVQDLDFSAKEQLAWLKMDYMGSLTEEVLEGLGDEMDIQSETFAVKDKISYMLDEIMEMMYMDREEREEADPSDNVHPMSKFTVMEFCEPGQLRKGMVRWAFDWITEKCVQEWGLEQSPVEYEVSELVALPDEEEETEDAE